MAVNDWTQRTLSFSYLGGYSGSFATRGWTPKEFDPSVGKVIFYEGYEDTTYKRTIYANTVYSYDPLTYVISQLKTNNWIEPNGASGDYTTVALAANSTDPTPADVHPNICIANGYVYKWGGLNQYITGATTNHPQDFWKKNTSTGNWTLISPTGTTPFWSDKNITMIYVPWSDEIILANCPNSDGGSSRNPYLLKTSSNVCRKFNGTEGTDFPSVFASACAVRDDKRKLIWFVMVGGTYSSPANEVWAYDYRYDKFYKVTTTNTPTGRAYPAVSFDTGHDCVLVTGGLNTYTVTGSPTQYTGTYVLTLDNLNWDSLILTTTPSASNFNYGAYDSIRRLHIVTNGLGEWYDLRYSPGADSGITTQVSMYGVDYAAF